MDKSRLLVIFLVAVTLASPMWAFPFYRSQLPNGMRVPNICDPGQIWAGVGHTHPQGGGPLNTFGKDFQAAGHMWTEALCQMDSDGDGVSNGVELGDPDCTWVTGQPAPVTEGITNPGLDENTFDCRVLMM